MLPIVIAYLLGCVVLYYMHKNKLRHWNEVEKFLLVIPSWLGVLFVVFVRILNLIEVTLYERKKRRHGKY